MSVHPIYGHDSLVQRLERAVYAGRFPQTVLLVGAPGVGKQRLALRLAEALFCQDEGAEPGADCRGAKQVRSLNHPDLHWFVPLVPNRRSSDRERQIQEAEEALGEAMAERRQDSCLGQVDPQASHSVAAARLMQRKAAVRPFQGRRKVFILGDADRLVVQEASQEAANALLKLLEEPPPHTTFVMTSSVPDALLPTMRSRAVTVRVGRIADGDVERFLVEQRGMGAEDARRAAAAAEGSIGRALAAEAGRAVAQTAARRFLAAVRTGPSAWAGESLQQSAWGARGGFTAMLDALAIELRGELSGGAGPSTTDGVLQALRRVAECRTVAQGNVNPQLATAVLASDLAQVL